MPSNDDTGRWFKTQFTEPVDLPEAEQREEAVNHAHEIEPPVGNLYTVTTYVPCPETGHLVEIGYGFTTVAERIAFMKVAKSAWGYVYVTPLEDEDGKL